MKKGEGARYMVNISIQLAYSPGQPADTAFPRPMAMMTKLFAARLAPYGVRVFRNTSGDNPHGHDGSGRREVRCR
jgi:NAD(P)-dependent dehydrogenase (short-subunit alcohol dehydrogenase family)